MAGGSDLDALQGGFRARALLLGLVLVGGLGAAVWTETRQQGEGEPESRHRLMVVSSGAEVDYHRVLARAGFEIEVQGYEDWLDAARAARPESEAEGIPLLLEHADIQGIGYLVLEGPQVGALTSVDLDIEPAPASIEDLDDHDYAVLSVGDLAFPHHLSLDPASGEPGEDLVRLPGFGALQAVFDQPSLLVREDDQRPTVEELQHEDAIEVGVRMVARPASFGAAIAEAEAAIADALALDPAVRLLAPEGHAGTAMPLAEGGVLVVHHAIEIYSRDGNRLELHPATTLALDYLAPAALDELLAGRDLVLEPCMSLAGGSLSLDDQPRLDAAVDGSALAITSAGGGTELWHAQPGIGCEFRSLGRVEDLGEGRLDIAPAPQAVDHGALALVEVGLDLEGVARVRAWSLPEASGPSAGLGSEQAEAGSALVDSELFALDEGQLGGVAFLDGDHLAILSSTPLAAELATSSRMREDAIHILDRRAPGAHLRVPAAFFAEDMAALHELEALAPAELEPGTGRVLRGPRLLLRASRGAGPSRLITLEIGAEAWADFVAQAPIEVAELGVEGRKLFTLTPEDLQAHTLDTGPGQLGLGLSVGEGAVAFVVADGDAASELAWLPLGPEASPSASEPERLTANGLSDRLAHFVGREALVFSTRIRTELSTRTYSVPRVTRLGSGS